MIAAVVVELDPNRLEVAVGVHLGVVAEETRFKEISSCDQVCAESLSHTIFHVFL